MEQHTDLLDRKIVFYLTVLITSFYSCQSPKRLAGEYFAESSDPTNNASISIRPDASFIIKSWSDVAGQFTTKGTWVIRNDTLFLEDDENKDQAIEYFYKYNIDSQNVTVKTFDKRDSIGLYFAKIYLNGSETPMDSLSSGIFSAKASEIKSLRVNYLSANIILEPPARKSNEVLLYWDFEKVRPTVQISRLWKVRGRKLIPLEEGYSVFKK